MNKTALIDLALMSGALMMGSQLTPSEKSDPRDKEGPIGNYNREAIRKQAAAERKAKHAEKMARRAANRKQA